MHSAKVSKAQFRDRIGIGIKKVNIFNGKLFLRFKVISGCEFHSDCWKKRDIEEKGHYCHHGICKGICIIQVTIYAQQK